MRKITLRQIDQIAKALNLPPLQVLQAFARVSQESKDVRTKHARQFLNFPETQDAFARELASQRAV